MSGHDNVCALTHGEQFPAKIIDLDAKSDLAALQLNLDQRPEDALTFFDRIFRRLSFR